MFELHIHPDDIVIIREDGVTLYVENMAEFEVDFEEELEWSYGPNWNEVQYTPGVMYRIFDGKTSDSLAPSWEQGDRIIAAVEDLMALYALRNPPPPEPE